MIVHLRRALARRNRQQAQTPAVETTVALPPLVSEPAGQLENTTYHETKKAPAKKAPAKKAPVKKAPAKKAPAKKAPAKKAPVKKAPAKKAPKSTKNKPKK